MSRWYRAYEGTVTDAKLAEAAMAADVSRALSVATWHAILEGAACQNNCGTHALSARRIAVIFCEPVERIEALLAAFDEIGLTADGAVASWKKRQFQAGKSDGTHNNGERYVYVVGTSWSTAVKIGFSKNPWARAKELQTGNASKVEVLAHFRCSTNSEVELHDVLAEFRHAGEWFNLKPSISKVFKDAAKAGATYEQLVSELRSNLRSATSLNITKTETETETDISEAKASSPRPWALPTGVSLQTWTDFLTNRKRKKLVNTPSTWKTFQDDLARVNAETGIPPPRLIELCTGKGWGGIYDPREHRGERPNQNHPGLGKTTAAIAGLGAWDDDRPM